MATKPLHKYTVAEASNLQVYDGYSSLRIEVDDDDTANNGTDWTTSGDGLAKEVNIIPITGNGSWGDDLQVLFDDFPITINNILMEQIRIESDGGTTGIAETFEVLSFHGTKPLHKYTVAEASNLQVYENYSSETVTVDDDAAWNYSGGNQGDGVNDWTSSGDGLAKEVNIIPVTGDNVAIKLGLKINGSWGDDIQVLFDDFPITINNILIEQIRLQSASGTTGTVGAETFEVLSFH